MTKGLYRHKNIFYLYSCIVISKMDMLVWLQYFPKSKKWGVVPEPHWEIQPSNDLEFLLLTGASRAGASCVGFPKARYCNVAWKDT